MNQHLTPSVEDEVEISYKGKQDASQQRVFRIQNLLTNCKDHKKEIKDTLIQDLKAVTLKSWSQKSKDDVIFLLRQPILPNLSLLILFEYI